MLVPPEAKAALDFLIKKRKEMGIPETNKYLFATPYKDSHLQGHTVIQKLAHALNLRQPKYFTSTNLRKYLATTMQVCTFLRRTLMKIADISLQICFNSKFKTFFVSIYR